jgi:6-phosphogluconolactonase
VVFAFDETTGRLTLQSKVQGIENPSYVCLGEEKSCLYAVSEVFGWNEGVVTAYSIDRHTGALTYINKQPTLGSITAFCTVDQSGKFLLVANYAHEPWTADSLPQENPGQAVVVFPIAENGALKPPLCSVAHHGRGPGPIRQERPHPHCAMPSPDGRFVLVPDLGIDKVMCYRFEDGKLTPAAASALTLPPGSGPRHLVFRANGRAAYVINELGSTVAQLRYNARSGKLDTAAVVSTLPAGFTGKNDCADVHLSPDERFLYGSNRGHDSIVIYKVDAESDGLALVGHTPTEGHWPRNFTITPSGRFLLVANQASDSIVIYRRDAETGLLHTIEKVRVGTPMCIKMCPRD